jgi:hypothetical protein
MHVVITIESMTIISPITLFELKFVPMFFHMDSIRKFKSFFLNWSYATVVVIIVGARRKRNSKGEKQLLIVDEEGEFDQNDIVLGNNCKFIF